MSDHTEGPWKAIADEPGSTQCAVVTADDRTEVVAMTKNTQQGHGTCEANARLIAAAPDLLNAALKAAHKADRIPGDVSAYPKLAKANARELSDILRNAIAKARGE